MLTPLPGVHRRMLFEGISAKKRLPWSQTGPSTHVNPVAMRSSMAPSGMMLLIEGSRRSTFSGVELRTPSAVGSEGWTRRSAGCHEKTSKEQRRSSKQGKRSFQPHLILLKADCGRRRSAAFEGTHQARNPAHSSFPRGRTDVNPVPERRIGSGQGADRQGNRMNQ